jgi:hypothetical protein
VRCINFPEVTCQLSILYANRNEQQWPTRAPVLHGTMLAGVCHVPTNAHGLPDLPSSACCRRGALHGGNIWPVRNVGSSHRSGSQSL